MQQIALQRSINAAGQADGSFNCFYGRRGRDWPAVRSGGSDAV